MKKSVFLHEKLNHLRCAEFTPDTFEESKDIAKEGGGVARSARLDIEGRLGKPVITSNNAKNKKLLDVKTEDSNQ